MDSKEIKPVNRKGNQSWIFIGRTDAEAAILWPPDAKSNSLEKNDAGKDWRQEEKGMTGDEMVGWHHWLDGREFEQAPGDGEGQGSLERCRPWGCIESDMTEWLNKKIPTNTIHSWLLLFSIMLLRLIHIITYISCLFSATAEKYSTVRTYWNLFIDTRTPPVYRHDEWRCYASSHLWWATFLLDLQSMVEFLDHEIGVYLALVWDFNKLLRFFPFKKPLQVVRCRPLHWVDSA